MILAALRMLVSATSNSLFLTDFVPTLQSLLVASWPSLTSSTQSSSKGKELMQEHRVNLVDAYLELALSTLQTLDPCFSPLIIERIMVKVLTILSLRLSVHHQELEHRPDPKTELLLLKILARLWSKTSISGMKSSLPQIIAAFIYNNGEKMVDLFVHGIGSASAELQVCCLYSNHC